MRSRQGGSTPRRSPPARTDAMKLWQPHPCSDKARWTPAPRLREDGFAAMLARTPAIDVSSAPASLIGEHRWIPAFAGMTVGGVPAGTVRTIIPAFTGITEEVVPLGAVRTVDAVFARVMPSTATWLRQLPSFPRRRESIGLDRRRKRDRRNGRVGAYGVIPAQAMIAPGARIRGRSGCKRFEADKAA